MRSAGRRRVTIAAVPLVIQPDTVQASSFAPPDRGELVSELPSSAADRADGQRHFEAVVGGWRFEVLVEPAARAELRDRAARAAAEHHATALVTLRAQIPGRVVKVWVAAGDVVEQNQRLLAVEAMKMENEIRAPRAGVVESVAVEMGARVERADELLTLS